MQLRRISQLALLLSIALVSCLPAMAQDAPAKRGRKYKAPPATSHIEVTVLKKFNGKPISNAAVIFDSTLDGKDQGNLEVKTDPEGKAVDRRDPHRQHRSRAGHRDRLCHLRGDYSSPSPAGRYPSP